MILVAGGKETDDFIIEKEQHTTRFATHDPLAVTPEVNNPDYRELTFCMPMVHQSASGARNALLLQIHAVNDSVPIYTASVSIGNLQRNREPYLDPHAGAALSRDGSYLRRFQDDKKLNQFKVPLREGVTLDTLAQDGHIDERTLAAAKKFEEIVKKSPNIIELNVDAQRQLLAPVIKLCQGPEQRGSSFSSRL